jgi:hypothetical protein
VQWRKDQGGMVSGLSQTASKEQQAIHEPTPTESIPQTAVHDPQSGHDGPAKQWSIRVSLSPGARRLLASPAFAFPSPVHLFAPTPCKYPTKSDDNTLPYLEVHVVQGQSCPEVL